MRADLSRRSGRSCASNRQFILPFVIFSLAGMDWRGFLGRPAFSAPSTESLERAIGEKILITGAGGSIGSALALRLAALRPRELLLLESSESSLFALQTSLRKATAVCSTRLLLGSVLDRNLVDEIFDLHEPGVVFHAAARKQVPLLEEHPLAAMETNVFGTHTVVRAAGRHNARLILLSTDKAVEPVSVMGATKRVAERIVLDAGETVVRLGNVLGSSGSVVEVFATQMIWGGPLTVTDPAARRYFLTIDEAVHMLIYALGEPGSLLVPLLHGQHAIADLARFMARMLAPRREIAIEFTSVRPGDKVSEKLLGPSETVDSARTSGLQSVFSPGIEPSLLHRSLVHMRQALDTRDLPRALAVLQALVPDYTPSATVLSLADQTASRVTP